MEVMKREKIAELQLVRDELQKILNLAFDEETQHLFFVEACVVLNKNPDDMTSNDLLFLHALILRKLQEIDDDIERIEKIGPMRTGKGRNKK
jgi:hypothetical protein